MGEIFWVEFLWVEFSWVEFSCNQVYGRILIEKVHSLTERLIREEQWGFRSGK